MMFKYILHVLALTGLLLSSSSLRAQQVAHRSNHRSDSIFHFEVYLNGGLPLGDFGRYSKLDNSIMLVKTSDNDPNDVSEGNSSVNFGLGFRFCFYLPTDGLLAFMNADCLIGLRNSSFDKDYRDYIEQNTTYNNIHHLPFHINIPLSWGLHYDWQLGKSFALFGEMGVGFNVAMLTELLLDVESFDPTLNTVVAETHRVNTTTKLSPLLNVGIGTNMGQHLRLGLYYYFMGSHNIEESYYVNNNLVSGYNNTTGYPRLTTQVLLLRLGFIF